MKSKGFTLIELLAVIVILAIIAVIAVPILLNIIDDSKESSKKESINMYAKAVEQAYADYQLNHPSESITTNAISSDSTGRILTIDGKELSVKYDGQDVHCDTILIKEPGNLYLSNCTVGGEKVDYIYGTTGCIITNDINKNGIAEKSDMITCGTESFYVMENNESIITMLSKFNLNFDKEPYTQDSKYLKKHITFYEDAYSTPEEVINGTVNSYEKSIIKPYVDKYQKYLQSDLGILTATASLMTLDQAKDLGCVEGNWEYRNNCTNAPEWVYSTSYWLETYIEEAIAGPDQWTINVLGMLYYSQYTKDVLNYNKPCVETATANYSCSDRFYHADLGIRPVITISTDELN